jgi:hypothetical protein
MYTVTNLIVSYISYSHRNYLLTYGLGTGIHLISTLSFRSFWIQIRVDSDLDSKPVIVRNSSMFFLLR